MKIKNWIIVGNPYHAPEIRVCYAVGEIYGHDRHPDGFMVRTTRLVDIKGKTVTTRSGSVYELEGDPDPDYAKDSIANLTEMEQWFGLYQDAK